MILALIKMILLKLTMMNQEWNVKEVEIGIHKVMYHQIPDSSRKMTETSGLSKGVQWQ
jgi:hypothetical protein